MKLRVVEVNNHAQNTIESFTSLPTKLYSKEQLPTNAAEERALLHGEHPLSGQFTIRGFVVLDGGRPVARGALTIYPQDQIGYFGFFESINNLKVCEKLCTTLESAALDDGCKQLRGPLDASFWIRYRLKVDNFGPRPYFNEPYNLPYYRDLLQQCGYEVTDTYLSNHHRRRLSWGEVKQFNQRYRLSRQKDYRITSPSRADKNTTYQAVHGLLSSTYVELPYFKTVTLEAFNEMYSGLWPYMDLSAVKLAYSDDKPVGFVIAFPNYENLLYRDRLGVIDRLRKNIKRLLPRQYVTLYMGVSAQHRGLGKALIRKLIADNAWSAPSYIGALIAEGKVTASYATSSIYKQSHYVMMGKKL